MTIFGAPLHELTLETLHRYMVDAEEEPLLWEAKATRINGGEVRKQVCGFANSHEGGYLILGADRPARDQPWKVPGHAFSGEATTWISDVILDGGVRPLPVWDTRVIRVRADRCLTVTRIDPISTPPCNTHGTVYERVSGETISVRDPQRLADLFARGDSARQGAEHFSFRAAEDTWNHAVQTVLGQVAGEAQAVVGLACTGTPPDISRRLFTGSFEARLEGVPDEHFPSPVEFGATAVQGEVSQTALTAYRTAELRLAPAIVARAYWTGAVGIYSLIGVTDTTPASIISKQVKPAISAAQDLQRALRGYGQAHLTVLVDSRAIRARPTIPNGGYVRIGRGPLGLDSVDDQGDSIRRELERATGTRSLEG